MRTSVKIITLCLLFMFRVHLVNANCIVQSVGSNKEPPLQSLLIEGCTTVDKNGTCVFPEIALASDLAKELGASIIDCIHSYDYEHMSAFILGRHGKNDSLTPHQEKLFALSIIYSFSRLAPVDGIIDQVIKKAYSQMQKDRLIPSVPNWVNQLDPLTFIALSEKMICLYGGKRETFITVLNEIKARATNVSNDLSKDSLLDYLEKNPHIKTVRALIGSGHLPFLDTVADKNRSTATHKSIKVNPDGHTVEVRLYGGLHGEFDHFNKLQDSLKPEQKSIECNQPKEKATEMIEQLSSAMKEAPKKSKEN